MEVWNGVHADRASGSSKTVVYEDYVAILRRLQELETMVNGSIIAVTGDVSVPSMNGFRLLLVDTTLGDVEIALPIATNQFGRIAIKKISADSNVIRVIPNGSEKIDGESELIIDMQWAAPLLTTNQSDWFLI